MLGFLETPTHVREARQQMMAGAATINWVSGLPKVISKALQIFSQAYCEANGRNLDLLTLFGSWVKSRDTDIKIAASLGAAVDSGKNNTLWVPQGAMVIKEYSHASSKMACVLQEKPILSMFPFPPYPVVSSGEFIKFIGQVEARELQLYTNIEKVNF
ncbi:hypothetical protein Tco_0500129 [Tanacetum coccineum]